MFEFLKKKRVSNTITIDLIEGGKKTRLFETAIEREATEFLERNMHVTGEMGVIETGLRNFGKVIVTVILTGKIIEVKWNK